MKSLEWLKQCTFQDTDPPRRDSRHPSRRAEIDMLQRYFYEQLNVFVPSRFRALQTSSVVRSPVESYPFPFGGEDLERLLDDGEFTVSEGDCLVRAVGSFWTGASIPLGATLVAIDGAELNHLSLTKQRKVVLHAHIVAARSPAGCDVAHDTSISTSIASTVSWGWGGVGGRSSRRIRYAPYRPRRARGAV